MSKSFTLLSNIIIFTCIQMQLNWKNESKETIETRKKTPESWSDAKKTRVCKNDIDRSALRVLIIMCFEST